MISTSRKQVTSLFLSLLLLLLLSPLLGSLPSAAAQTASYAELSRTAIDRIDKAAALIKSGDAAQAKELIDQAKESLGILLERTQQLQSIANQEHDRCVQNQGEIEKRVNDLYTRQQQESDKLKGLQGELAEASKSAELSQNEITRLHNDLNATQKNIRETQEKLQELSKWWWVPGYGQYLSVRTLVNNDIAREQRLIRNLNEQREQLRKNQVNLRGTRKLMDELLSNQRQTEQLLQDLQKMESENQSKLEQFKLSSVFLTDAEVFWGEVGNSLDVNGSNFIDTMEILQKRLAERGQGTRFPVQRLQSADSFREALLGFADSVDKNTSFLLNPEIAYCGGPLPPPNPRETYPQLFLGELP